MYRVDNKDDPFAINKEDYNRRYIKNVVKNYKLGIPKKNKVEWLDKESLYDMLVGSSDYLDEIHILSKHYLVNDRLIEIVLEELSEYDFTHDDITHIIDNMNIQKMMNHIGEEFSELEYDDYDKIIKGNIDGVYQSLEFSERLLRKSIPLINIINKYCPEDNRFVLRDVKGTTEVETSLLGVLKILEKYKPEIKARFKGLK